MTDYTEGPKPWDIEQFRGVRRHTQRKTDWEKDRELVLDASYRTGKVAPKYATDGPSLFWLALKTACLSVLTVGFYRFWMITRLPISSIPLSGFAPRSPATKASGRRR